MFVVTSRRGSEVKLFIDIKLIALGLAIGWLSKEAVSNVSQNYAVYRFLDRELSWSILKPNSMQNWATRDARIVLTPKPDEKGNNSCLYVLPVKPEYSVVSKLEDGTKLCCSISESSVFIPYRETAEATEYYCGTYPNQQVVRVLKTYPK
ncbi:hypothetical protein I7Z51_004588 [Vibrio parahaemolyticus]|uniref:hypothetical protein n=1 Tax=Vibrio TaxID=662 RepID=UPI001A8E8E66|nr:MULTISPECIES: hypothetical protein [Vibrio]EGQ7975606.1 hypothetical protein [Vibrio parahaemolyticus]MBO0211151.1 hypothetical protein [Vibrio sp. Vb0877]MCR9808283.1 hypothetical protein [Vibrio parahaemolyticus]MDW2320154.1 hypothetical protein [Vibrio sp. 1159]